MTEMREAFAVFAPYRDVPKVTVFGSARTRRRPALRPGDRDRRSWPRGAGWSSPAPVRGSCRRRWRAPGGAQHRRVDPPPVRAGRQPGDRRRREVRQHEVLLHPQADARQGEPGVRLPARRLRHARRDVRAAHPDPDRQGPARADRLPRHAGRPVLGGDRRDDPRAARPPRSWRPADTQPVPRHRLARRRPPRSTASTATTTRSATSATT